MGRKTVTAQRSPKPDPPPYQPPAKHVCGMGGLGRAVQVRSKASGKAGVAYVDDPHVWVEGQGVAGWYRASTLASDFIVEEGKTDG